MEAFFVGNVPLGANGCHALIVLICNIIISGLGTLLAGCLFAKETNNQILLWALLQFVCTIIFVGWIWSIWWGIVYFINRDKGETLASSGADEQTGLKQEDQHQA